nr:cilia- and flagella-associated protein 36-like [Cherax quadricarinatus]
MGEEDNAWVLDSLVNFLRGPVWNVPILTFIEHKSLKGETTAHLPGKTVVKGNSGNVCSLCHTCMLVFVCLRVCVCVFALCLSLSLSFHGVDTSTTDMTKEEQHVLEEIKKKSLEDHQALQEGLDAETRDLERALVESKEEKERLEQERDREKQMLEEALKLSLSDTPGEVTPREPLPPFQSTEVNPEELKKRQEYLKAQRDKLLALKQEEREKQLAAFEKSEPQKRPKSSRAARKVLEGSTIDAQTLHVRKALAERLKAEVIGEQ